MPEETFLDNKALTAATHMQQVHLDPLSTWECTDLLALHFKVRKVDAELAALVFRHSSGNPGFAEQFIGSLQDNGKLLTGGDTVTLGNDVDLDKVRPWRRPWGLGFAVRRPALEGFWYPPQ